MRLVLSILFILTGLSFAAQTYPLWGNYIFNTSVINPAFQSDVEALKVVTSWREQWIGLEGAPSTQSLTAIYPFKKHKNMSCGFLAYSDRIGVTDQKGLNFTYAYGLKIAEEEKLSFGLGGGITVLSQNFTSLSTNDNLDPVFANARQFTTPDFRFGISYKRKNTEVGWSLPRMIDINIAKGGQINFGKTMFVYFQHNHYLSDLVQLTPSILLRSLPMTNLQLDVNCLFTYRAHYFLGLGYRTSEGIVSQIGAKIKNRIHVGMQAEFPAFAYANLKAPTLEFLLTYKNLYKLKGSNPRFL